MKTSKPLTFLPERKGLKNIFFWYGLLMFVILAVALVFMAKFDGRAVREQEDFLKDQHFLSASLTRLAWEDQLQNVRFQRSFLLDEVFLKVVRGDMTPVQAKSILSPFVYNNPALLGYCFMGMGKDAPPLLISAYRSTPSGKAAWEFVESFRYACDFPQGVTDLTENDPVFSLSGKILITPELKLMILVDPLIRWRTVPGYLLTVMDLTPFISRYVLPVVREEDGAAMVIHQDGTVIQHKNMELLGKNLNDPSVKFPAGLKEAWARLKGDMSGKGDFLLARKAEEAPPRKLLAWNSLRIGSERMLVVLSSSEEEINKALSDLRFQRYILGFFLVLFLLLINLLFLRRRGELEARSSESAFRSIFNSATAAIAVLDREGRFLTGNSRWEEITGRSLDELRGVSLFDLGSPPSREEKDMFLSALEQGAEFQRAELVFSENRTIPFWADVTLNRLQEEENLPSRAYLAIVTDITGLKNAEDQLKKNALLLQRQKMELQKQTADQEILLALFAQFSRAKTLEELLSVLSSHLPSILSYRNLFIWLRSPDAQENFEATDLLGEIEKTGQTNFPQEMKGIVGQVLSTGKAYISGDLSADPHYIPHSSDACSIAFVPVAYRGTIWGLSL
ncbi:MAG: PAS domain S-box protein, partial [Synergistaceae bacterium]|nr:PAS domain S-box protein [Synergistaceae bacterium]